MDARDTLIDKAWTLRERGRDAAASAIALQILAERVREPDGPMTDAYALLGGLAFDRGSFGEALRHYRRGVDCGADQLRLEADPQQQYRFWLELDTRPYMRCRQGLMLTLDKLGQRDGAVAHAEDLLRLCPSDNLGVRYLLVSWLVQQQRPTAARRALRAYFARDGEYGEPFPMFAELVVALGCRDHGNTIKAAAARAVRAYPLVGALIATEYARVALSDEDRTAYLPANGAMWSHAVDVAVELVDVLSSDDGPEVVRLIGRTFTGVLIAAKARRAPLTGDHLPDTELRHMAGRNGYAEAVHALRGRVEVRPVR